MATTSIQLSDETQRALAELGVVALYLFGSRAQGIEGPLSDYDFAVLVKDPQVLKDAKQKTVLYNALYNILSPLCPRTLANDIIDIVFLDDVRVPLELKMHVVEYGKILFEDHPRQRADFVEKTVEMYCDFRPILDMFDRAILARL